jgi:putative flippase GtrA
MTLSRLLAGGSFAKVLRFSTVGLANALIYALVTAASIHFMSIPARTAALVGYIATLPFAFFAHKHFTFRKNGDAASQALRFLITYCCGLFVSVLAMDISVDRFGLHYMVGVAVAIILVPIVTLVVLDHWVFRGPLDAIKTDKIDN